VSSYRIPFNKPAITGNEIAYVTRSIQSGHLSGDGNFTEQCQRFMTERFRARQVLLTTSCTTALEMTALIGDIGPGDEVIMPSYTFVSTANAFALRGAKIIFVDIRPDTLNMDEKLLVNAVTDRTKAIAPVHYAGVACEMDEICAIAKGCGAVVIEDAAQGVDATYKGAYLGTIGDFGTYSFHETKNFVCGEGGALLVNNEDLHERAEIIREKGTNRSQFFRGQVDKYTWIEMGSSALPSDMLAAYLYAQFENMDVINTRRRTIYEGYLTNLAPLAEQRLVTLPTIPAHCRSNYHMFYILLHDLETRTRLIEHLKQDGILAVFHYVPLHTSPVGQSMGYREGMLPVTEDLSERLLRLPMYFDMSKQDVSDVVSSIKQFFRI
jgi:dTDP-4-amino-4,6-dideoxygalactose transaminase